MKIHFVVGPTASGKSDFAVRLAAELGTEVVGADSVQIYREFNIGSAKISPEEMRGIPHHLIDRLDPREEFTVKDYETLANSVIQDVYRRTGAAVVCGGTGFYINSLLYRMDDIPSADVEVRERLGGMELQPLIEYAYSLGMTLDRVERSNRRRVIRAVEIFLATGKELGSYQDLKRTEIEPVFHYLLPERAVLYDRINLRVEKMLEQGLVEETENIVRRYGRNLQALRSIGYRECCMYLDGHYDLAAMADEIKKSTRHYAKRQITWFNRYAGLI